MLLERTAGQYRIALVHSDLGYWCQVHSLEDGMCYAERWLGNPPAHHELIWAEGEYGKFYHQMEELCASVR